MEHFLNRPMPPGLEMLVDLALDLRWTWSHATDHLWRTLAPDLWSQTRNPWLLLQRISQRRLDETARDMDFVDELARFVEARGDYMSGTTWFGETHRPDDYTVAYFCMEYGLAEALPLYSGGLGILAGDHLKTASDLGVPLVAVGLLYQEGYFRQMIDAHGGRIGVHTAHGKGSTFYFELPRVPSVLGVPGVSRDAGTARMPE